MVTRVTIIWRGPSDVVEPVLGMASCGMDLNKEFEIYCTGSWENDVDIVEVIV